MIGVKGDGMEVTGACRICDCEACNILFEEARTTAVGVNLFLMSPLPIEPYNNVLAFAVPIPNNGINQYVRTGVRHKPSHS
jgi:hypothetical protein